MLLMREGSLFIINYSLVIFALPAIYQEFAFIIFFERDCPFCGIPVFNYLSNFRP
jgi:uncharacterized membrane protein